MRLSSPRINVDTDQHRVTRATPFPESLLAQVQCVQHNRDWQWRCKARRRSTYRTWNSHDRLHAG